MASLRQTINGLDKTHRINLCAILGIDKRKNSSKSIADEINRLYQSSIVTKSKQLIPGSLKKASGLKILKSKPVDYESLIIETSKKLKVYDKNDSITDLEQYLIQAILVQSLSNMNPKERNAFFTKAIDLGDVVEKANIQNASMKGPLTTLTAIQLANLGGFGTYLTATTALGFVTHGVGITLPFATYIGLSSTISFVLGPAGFLGAALWAGWKLTNPNWKKIVPVLVYILTQKHSNRL